MAVFKRVFVVRKRNEPWATTREVLAVKRGMSRSEVARIIGGDGEAGPYVSGMVVRRYYAQNGTLALTVGYLKGKAKVLQFPL